MRDDSWAPDLTWPHQPQCLPSLFISIPHLSSQANHAESQVRTLNLVTWPCDVHLSCNSSIVISTMRLTMIPSLLSQYVDPLRPIMLSIVPRDSTRLDHGVQPLEACELIRVPRPCPGWFSGCGFDMITHRAGTHHAVASCLYLSLFFDDLDHLPRGVKCRVRNENRAHNSRKEVAALRRVLVNVL